MAVISGLFHFILLGAILLLPGAALRLWLRRLTDSLLILAADCAALSISLYALIALLGYLGGVSFPGWLVITFLCACLISVAGAFLLRRPKIQVNREDLAGLLLLAGLTAWRFFQARDLALPAWVDSVHHTLIAQKILQIGGLPASLMPEVNAPFFYHYGFHLLPALFSGLSGLPVENAVLTVGQVLNALAALSVYRLAKAFWPRGGRAAAAGLLTGFVLQMPAYYLAWGRYTLLTGMLLLPAAVALAYETSSAPPGQTSWQRSLQLQLITAGLALTHLLALALLGIYLLIQAGSEWRRQRDLRAAAAVLWPAGLGLVLALPWLVRVLRFSSRYARVALVPPGAQGSLTYGAYLWDLAGPFRNQFFLGLALVGLICLLRRGPLRRLGVFSALLALLALPWGVRFEPFRPDHLVIVLYLPAALLLSDLGSRLYTWSARLPAKARLLSVVVVSLAVLIWGLADTANLVRRDTILAERSDVQALKWIKENTSANANFLINTRLWQAGSFRGVDGGYWISTYTGRRQILPPAVYGYGALQEIRRVNDLAGRVSGLTGCDEPFWKVVEDAGITHVYVKEGTGSIQPRTLLTCPGLLVIYQREGVYLFEVVKE